MVGGAPNPYVYPDNLPRVNARGGPGGAPGCWQPITRDLWPAPNLVMDTGASLAPYNHFDTGSPLGNRVCVGPPSRGQHDQPMKTTGSAIKLGIVSLVLLLFTVVDRRGVRPDALQPHQQLFRGVQQCQRAARGQFVRASGVEIGKVKKVRLVDGGKRVRVDFAVDRSIQLYQSTTAQIRYLDLIGNRYLELKRGEGEGADRVLPPGGFIPLSRTHRRWTSTR